MKMRLRKSCRLQIAALFFAAVLCCSAAALSVSNSYGVTKERLRVRASASLKAQVVDQLDSGSCVYILSSSRNGDTNFAKVRYRSASGAKKTGYAAISQGKSTYIKTLSAAQAKSRFGVSGGSLPGAAQKAADSSSDAGANDRAVRQAQEGLKALGLYSGSITGHAGERTVKAIRAFQKKHGLKQSGKADSATLKAIANAQKTGTKASGSEKGLTVGSKGSKVKTLQKNLTTLGYYYGNITGHYGEKTAAAVRKYQEASGLSKSGVASDALLRQVAAAAKRGKSSGGAGKELYTLDWFAAKESGVFRKIGFAAGKTATLTDVSTGKSLKVRIQSSGQHLDVEPLTKSDTKTLCSIYGVSKPKKIGAHRRAMILETVHGYRIACSCYGTPHGSQFVRDNNYPGQFCLHFLNSKTSASGRVDGEHQSAVRRAVATVGKKNVVKLNDPEDIR